MSESLSILSCSTEVLKDCYYEAVRDSSANDLLAIAELLVLPSQTVQKAESSWLHYRDGLSAGKRVGLPIPVLTGPT